MFLLLLPVCSYLLQKKDKDENIPSFVLSLPGEGKKMCDESRICVGNHRRQQSPSRQGSKKSIIVNTVLAT